MSVSVACDEPEAAMCHSVSACWNCSMLGNDIAEVDVVVDDDASSSRGREVEDASESARTTIDDRWA